MAEIGLALGVVSLIPMIIDGFQKLVVFSLECESLERQVTRARCTVDREKLKFFDSIRTLLQDTVDEGILSKLEDVADHRDIWRGGGELAAAVEQTTAMNTKFGKRLQAALKEIYILFHELNNKLEKISQLPKADPSHRAWMVNFLNLQKQKVKWHTITHLRAEHILLHIVEQNANIQELVRQVRQCVRVPPSEPVQLLSINDIGTTQRTYGMLYGAFATSWTLCACRQHSVSLSLDTQQGGKTTKLSTVIDIKPCEPIESMMVRERLGWHLDILQGNQDSDTPEAAHFSYLSEPICSSLGWRASGDRDNESRKSRKLLACLKLESKSAFQVTDPGCNGHSSSLQQSLATVLKVVDTGSSSPHELKQSVRESRRRLQLAYSLALHLVRLYSTRWLTGHADWVWTSQDIVFFPSHTERRWRDASPYLFPPSPNKGQSGGVKRQLGTVASVKHPHIFALGAILVELALGEQFDPSLSGHEYVQVVSSIVVGQSLEAQLGRRYAELVRRCVFFNSESEKIEFSDMKAQQMFLNNVVGPLHECLLAQERRTGMVIAAAL